MSPSQFRRHHQHDNNYFLGQQVIMKDVNCLRETTNTGRTPLPLKINKESHRIHKSSSSSLTSSASSSINGVINGPPSSKNQHQQQQRHPVIIYTHSPKIIHTQARDFMALVQKLTGLSHTDQPQNQSGGPVNNGGGNNLRGGGDDTGSSSVVTTDENCGGGGGGGGGGFGLNIHEVSSSGSLDQINNSYISDIPIFTPNSLGFLYSSSSTSFYRYQSPMIFPPSPEIAKPEYQEERR